MNMNGQPYTTIFFDIGGVCLTNGWDNLARQRATEHFSIPYEETELRHQEVFESLERDEVSFEEYMDEVYFFKERQFTKEAFLEFVRQQSRPYEETLQLLEKLKSNGHYQLATINNESLQLNLYRINKYRLDDYFSTFFSSCFVGVRKPKQQIYETALHVLYTQAQKCLFIDDRKENVDAAEKTGIDSIHLKEVNKLEEALKEKGIKI